MTNSRPCPDRVWWYEEDSADQYLNTKGQTAEEVITSTSPSHFGSLRLSQYRGTTSSEQPGDSDRTWSFGRVVLAIVPATTRYMAAALGAAAFSQQDGFVDDSAVVDSDVKPVYDFETVPASTLSSDWGGELPAAIRRDTDLGRQLLDTALEKTDQSAEPTPYLYDAEGNPLLGRDDLEAVIQTESEKPYWVVPGIVRRYTIVLPDGPETQLSCQCRSIATPHVFTGRGGAPSSVPEIARPIWVCRLCGRPTYGLEPSGGSPISDTPSESILGPDGEPVTLLDGPAQEHEQAVTSYYEEYEMYPWEDGFDS